MKYILFWLLSLSFPQPPAVQPIEVSIHAGFDSLLQKNVSDMGIVNYKGLKKDKAQLDAYLQVLSDNIPEETDSRAEKMAYWINAYNAFTLDLIVSNYPTTSITKFDDGKTWDVKRIKLANKKYSLNKIENEILRPQFKDPRIHFAVNCAAKSCPPLYNHAYTAENLETTLEARTKAFVNNTKYNTLTNKSVKISRIFDWYSADFGNIQAFLNKYSNKKINSGATVEYNEYNWDLNE